MDDEDLNPALVEPLKSLEELELRSQTLIARVIHVPRDEHEVGVLDLRGLDDPLPRPERRLAQEFGDLRLVEHPLEGAIQVEVGAMNEGHPLAIRPRLALHDAQSARSRLESGS